MKQRSATRVVRNVWYDGERKGHLLSLSCGHTQFTRIGNLPFNVPVLCNTCMQMQDESNGYGVDRKSYQG